MGEMGVAGYPEDAPAFLRTWEVGRRVAAVLSQLWHGEHVSLYRAKESYFFFINWSSLCVLLFCCIPANWSHRRLNFGHAFFNCYRKSQLVYWLFQLWRWFSVTCGDLFLELSVLEHKIWESKKKILQLNYLDGCVLIFDYTAEWLDYFVIVSSAVSEVNVCRFLSAT